MTVSIVVAIGDNGVIGREGDLPWPPTGDLKQFKDLTMGHPLVMGRTTFESIGRPLPGRTSIVLTRDTSWQADGVEVAHSLADAVARGSQLSDTTFIIGGAQVYAEALAAGVVDEMVITHVHQSPEGDAWFPEVDWQAWRQVTSAAHEGYDITTYQRA
jgi:dihydrofolate reductase